MNAHLLGIYEANGHLSIRNYFDCCYSALPSLLPEWSITSSKPGRDDRNLGVTRSASRSQAFFENYLEWPVKLRSVRADLFHIVDQSIAWYRSFLRSGKAIVTVHDLINIMMMRGHLDLGSVPPLRRWKMRMCVQELLKADALVCVSGNTADCVMRELDLPGNRVHVVHNIVASEFRPALPPEREQLRRKLCPDGEPIMLHVGKPSHYKNRTGVIEIFKRVRTRIKECRLVLTGTSLTAAEVAAVGEESLLEAISVHLPPNREQMRDLYCAADLLVFPSLYEGFGWPPIEAMACDCPVISSSRGSLSEVIGSGGIVIPDPCNYDGFAEAARTLILDSTLRKQTIANGRRNALRFSRDAVMPRLAQIYQQVAA